MQKRRSLFSKIPYWFLAIILIGLLLLWGIIADGDYQQIFIAISSGLWTTLYVTVIAFSLSLFMGLIVCFARISEKRVIREVASFYVEIVRGIPMLVLLYYIAFVGAPGLIQLLNWLGSPLIEADIIEKFRVRDLDFTWRAILALTIGYSAFIAEIFRAGIESVDKGQMEAARGMGMGYWQAMYLIILPQAIRTVLPPLGNDFVAMVKDSALVSALGVQDLTQLGKVYSASTFLFFETYNIVAFLYLFITISLSLLIRGLEKYLEKYKI